MRSRTPSLRSEVEWAVRNILNGKASGMDDIPTELLESPVEGFDILWRICKLMRTKGDWPKYRCRTVFIKLPKKGNLKEYFNYRTISLVVLASNFLLNIIKGTIRLRGEMAEEPAGFVEGC